MDSHSILICFAVKEEAAAFREAQGHRSLFHLLLTGIGQKNAEQAIRPALERHKPNLVLTCGFAGALDPKLQIGDVAFDADAESNLAETLRSLGAVPVKFHCAERVVVTAVEKSSLRQSTGADAVEMESSVIRAAARERGIGSATLRVISDVAAQDLPLDFNALLGPDGNVSMLKLTGALLKSPDRIPRLLELQRNTQRAARRLADVLDGLLRKLGSDRGGSR